MSHLSFYYYYVSSPNVWVKFHPFYELFSSLWLGNFFNHENRDTNQSNFNNFFFLKKGTASKEKMTSNLSQNLEKCPNFFSRTGVLQFLT